MALPEFTMRQLLEAGVHFGHQTHRWNPKMQKYIFGKRNNIHIIDLSITVPLLHQALQQVSDTVAAGGRVLFVGTKRQASEIIADAAKRSAQYYVNARWLGGMLTNWKTISKSINRLRKLEEMLGGDNSGFTKKELLNLTRELNKLERALGGIKDMGGKPDLVFIIDTNKEMIAILEARRLKIPIAAILDTNCDPDFVDFPIPGNDDAARAISLYCDLVAKAALDGIQRQQSGSGVDIGAMEEAPVEEAIKETILEATPEVAEAKPEETVKPAAAEESKQEAAKESKPAAADESKQEDTEKPAAAKESKPTAEKAAPAKKSKPAKKETTPDETEKEATDTDKTAKDDADESAPLFARPKGDGDDLTKISGVGPVLLAKLNDLGIITFEQIANFSPEDITRVDDRLSFKGRIERDGWLKQAAEFAKG